MAGSDTHEMFGLVREVIGDEFAQVRAGISCFDSSHASGYPAVKAISPVNITIAAASAAGLSFGRAA